MSFAGLLNQVATHYPTGSYDAHGQEVTSGGTSYKVRAQKVTKLRMRPNGDTYTVALIIFSGASTVWAINDKVVYDSETYKVMSRRSEVGGNGEIHHYEYELSVWQI